MMNVYSKSAMGYSHKASKTPCQDYTLSYVSPDSMIIACCDGHGGKRYIRSKTGSKLACKAILNVFSNINRPVLRRIDDSKYLDRIKLEVLCEWNHLVEQDLKQSPLRLREFKDLSKEDVALIKANPTKAYGSTLSGALLINDKLVVISIGDTEAIAISKGNIYRIFDDVDEPVANITYSLCQEDAFQHMAIKVIDVKSVDGILLCTDGLTSPYQSYANFNESFVKPLMRNILIDHDVKFVDRFIDSLATHLGVGDDVSLAYIINPNVYKKYYK